MNILTWFKTHQKLILIHEIIISVFLLFLLFLAEPLFDNLERIPGESSLTNISVKETNGNAQCVIGQIIVTSNAVEINGWAFIQDIDSNGSVIYLVLKSDDKRYIFTTDIVERKDVTLAFKDRETNFNYDFSGFNAVLAQRNIPDGEYDIAVYITNEDTIALKNSGDILEKRKGIIKRSKKTVIPD